MAIFFYKACVFLDYELLKFPDKFRTCVNVEFKHTQEAESGNISLTLLKIDYDKYMFVFLVVNFSCMSQVKMSRYVLMAKHPTEVAYGEKDLFWPMVSEGLHMGGNAHLSSRWLVFLFYSGPRIRRCPGCSFQSDLSALFVLSRPTS